MLCAGLLGLTGVLAGTFCAHGLKNRLSASMQDTFEIGVRYHLVHASCVLAIVAFIAARQANPWLLRAAWSWTFGIVVFSGSLYALAVSDMQWLGWVTPVGGVAFIAGWGCVCMAACTRQSN